MFYLRYDDIEGLFREAAENYQINADKAFDWDKVQRNVHEEPDKEKKPGPKKNKKRKFIFGFLLLFSIGWLLYNNSGIETEKKLAQQNISKENKSILNKKEDKTTHHEQNESNLEKQEAFDKSVSNKNKSEAVIGSENFGTKKKGFTIDNLKGDDETVAYNSTILNKETNADISPIPLLTEKTLLNTQSQNLNKNLPSLIQYGDNLSPVSTSKNKHTKKNILSGFYARAFVAPVITFVEFQRSSGIGFTFGLTAGYQINKNWSIESGISLDRKKYYTTGEYFDKSNVPGFYNADLLSVDGHCNMFEVPLNIRYKFESKSSHNFTASLGASSYFMTKESYNYSMISWGQTVNGKFTNFPKSTNLFSAINVSAGYEKKLNNVSLLIEPYFKVPVKGIGTGNLYMSSTGINIGLKKYFGKK
jgi:hypothetical protein